MTLYMMAIVQLRTRTTHGRAYDDRTVAAGKTPNEAMHCLKRRLSDIVYCTMLGDVIAARRHQARDGPGRTPGRVTNIQRGRLTVPHRHFGSVTSRTRHHQGYDRSLDGVLTGRVLPAV